MRVRHLLLLVPALLLGTLLARAQPLPEGLQLSGGVISMQPIPDSDQSANSDTSQAPEYREGTGHVLSAADHDLYAKAFDAADRGDWTAARNFASQGHDAIARKLIQWRYLMDKNSGASFAEIDAFLKANPDWPLRGNLYARAEEALDPASSASTIIAWFGGRDPQTALGEIRLGEAYIAAGRLSDGRTLIREGWANGSFEPDQELAIVQKDGAYLTPDTDRLRLSNLLWRDEISAARREMSRVDDSSQRLAEARIEVQTSPQTAARIIADLSADLGSDPDLMFDRARAARRAGDNDGAEAILSRVPAKQIARLHPATLWGELNIEARQALQDGHPRLAYQLVSGAGFTSGTEFAESEFLAGWIALRFLKDPPSALAHFKTLAGGVSRPISLSRARYWAGRAYEDMGDIPDAWQQYHLAATAADTFYGQLALARIDATPVLHLRPDTAEPAPPRATFDKDELGRAMRVLADLGAENYLRSFAVRYQELHPDAGHVKLLAQALVDMGFRDVAVRAAKTASYNDIVLWPYSHPVIPIPIYRGPGEAPEPALVLGLIRQETEFDPTAVSHAGARGIMQIMPATARRNAKLADLPYRPNDLTSDVNYNMQLGMTEFSGYLGDWGHSLILSAAAYNAGPTNAKKWIAAFGDPRSPPVDPVDWIEQIPFGETRNYVMRVMENLQTYRVRLAGRDQPLRILADLYGPNPAPTKVLVYTPPPPAAVPVPTPKPGADKTASKTD